MPASLLDRSLAAVWHPCTQMQHHETLPLVPVVGGEGPWLITENGQRLLDGISSWWVNLFGHCNPRINAALRDQLEKIEHVMLAGFTHQPVVELAERLSALTDGTLGHAFFASDGASATEIALKMSFHTWQNRGFQHKTRFLCLEGSYHGETVGALAVTDVPLFKDAYGPLVRHAWTVASPDARLAAPDESPANLARRAAESLQSVFASEGEQIAAFIVEPLVQGAAGMVMYDPEYLRLARALCDQYHVHLICDEIAVGCGRTGTFFAHEQAAIRPDLLCLSKGISGGYLPLSIVLATDDIYRTFYDPDTRRGFLHSHSYTGNPLACRAALATLDIFDTDDVLANNRDRALFLGQRLDAVFSKHPAVQHLRQLGTIAAFDVAGAPVDFSRRFFSAAIRRGALLRPIGNTIYFMPPYVMDKTRLDELVSIAEKALDEALSV